MFSNKDLEKIINMYVNQKKGPSAICKEFNCSRSVIDRVLKEMNIQIRSRGEGVQATRLQPDYVDPRIGKIKNRFSNFNMRVIRLLLNKLFNFKRHIGLLFNRNAVDKITSMI